MFYSPHKPCSYWYARCLWEQCFVASAVLQHFLSLSPPTSWELWAGTEQKQVINQTLLLKQDKQQSLAGRPHFYSCKAVSAVRYGIEKCTCGWWERKQKWQRKEIDQITVVRDMLAIIRMGTAFSYWVDMVKMHIAFSGVCAVCSFFKAKDNSGKKLYLAMKWGMQIHECVFSVLNVMYSVSESSSCGFDCQKRMGKSKLLPLLRWNFLLLHLLDERCLSERCFELQGTFSLYLLLLSA